MERRNVEGAAQLLVNANRTGRPIERLPSDMIPRDVEGAYAVQDAVAALRGPITGWKISNGSPPTCSPTFRREAPGARLSAADFHLPLLEVEFGFVALEDMPARATPYSQEEVFERIAFAPVIEIVASRYLDRAACSRLELLCDGSNGALIAGEPVRDWRGLRFRQIPVALAIDGEVVQSAVGTHPLENPADLVVWLANHAMGRGGLRRDVVATTGGLKGATPVQAGARVSGEWGGLGQIALTFI